MESSRTAQMAFQQTRNGSNAPGALFHRESAGSVNEAIEAFVAKDSSRWLPRFSLRGLFLIILLMSLLFGWASSEQRAERERRMQEQRQRYAEEELRRARDELRDQMRGRGRIAYDLSGQRMHDDRERQQCVPTRLVPQLPPGGRNVGGWKKKLARFDAAKLARGCLKGGDASFQESSFVGADLTGATLTGGSSSFQRASFEGAILVGARLSGNFQVVNIRGLIRRPLGDRSTTWPVATSRPTYDAKTKFPPGFDPVERSWNRAD